MICVPVAWWSGHVLFGVRTAWIAAVLAALNPWLTTYAQESRMYSLTALLGWIAMVCFLRAFALRHDGERVGRGWLIGFAVALAAMMYTHNWALFFAIACGVTWLGLIWLAEGPERRDECRVVAVVVGLLRRAVRPVDCCGAERARVRWCERPLHQLAADAGAS